MSRGQARMLSPVCRVYWDLPGGRHALVVSADGSSFLADHVLVMLPLGVLQEHHRSIFNPSLPTTLTRALMVSVTIIISLKRVGAGEAKQ